MSRAQEAKIFSGPEIKYKNVPLHIKTKPLNGYEDSSSKTKKNFRNFESKMDSI